MADYVLSRAKIIVSKNAEGLDTYVVRITPDMDDIEEIAFLPQYPAFFPNHVESYQRDEIVWCLHTKDYQAGYVLGLSENATGRNVRSLFSKITDMETKFELPVSTISDISFSMQGGILDFIDKKLLISGRLTPSGASLVFTSKGEIFLDTPVSDIHLSEDGEVSIEGLSETHDISRTYDLKANEIDEKSNLRKIKVTGNSTETIAGDSSKAVLGIATESYAKNHEMLCTRKDKETLGLGKETTIAAGGQKTTILAGDYTLTVGLGGVNITTGKGMNLLLGPTGLKIISAGSVNIAAPTIKLSTLSLNLSSISLKSAMSIFGGGAFCALPFCLFTGAPHTTRTFVGIPT